MKPHMRAVGASRDKRTNVWNVTLSCGHTFTPPTTMLAFQHVDCPRCSKCALLKFNTDEIEEYDSK